MPQNIEYIEGIIFFYLSTVFAEGCTMKNSELLL